MSEYVAPVLTLPQAREAREALLARWATLRSPGVWTYDPAAARACLNGIRALDAVLPGPPAAP